ncbi:hypothetical protein [Methylobrevis pamukkalensis]|uniref:hypothetical protein n=1 Tax=Methylobrevis pamukkalensis TaxID=1439726 RepID=UPI0008461066|nr:hypothetical protein [Methylobrevis pamukkalensis]
MAQTRLCRLVVAAAEPEGRIRIVDETPITGVRHGVAIRYTVEIGSRIRPGEVRCAFEGGLLGRNRLRLAAVETREGLYPDSRLYILERFWLADPETPDRVGQRLSLPGEQAP